MKKLLPILNAVGRVLTGLALASIAGMNLLMGYIMFAPDELPKPFYLAYRDGSAAIPSTAEAVAVPGAEQAGPGAASSSPTGQPEMVVMTQPGQGIMVETGTKIVNLADPGGRRYLKATIVLEVAPPPGVLAATAEAGQRGGEAAGPNAALTAFNDEINQRMPMINDILTTLLSSKTFESIYTVEGKEALRKEILTELDKRLPDLHVIAVYFTEFVVQ
ncbi:MAG: flagellar basal body-associated FliL family protein [Chloroflexi bacterium]|nr:flagellar basal body-associated FliL family protein [Chloroflexota bacterium]